MPMNGLGADPNQSSVYYSSLRTEVKIKILKKGVRKMKKIFYGGIILPIFIILMGCGLATTKKSAEKVTVNFYEAIKVGNFNEAVNNVGDIGFSQTPRENWIALLQDINTKVGNLQGYQLGSWGFDTSTGKGTTITLNVSAVYAKASWNEKVKLFKPPGTDKVQIIAYTVNIKDEENKTEEKNKSKKSKTNPI